MTRLYYSYDSAGMYTNFGEAKVLPGREDLDDSLDKKFQLPAHATFEAPPSFTVGENVPIFANGVWSLVEDHRGTVYDKQTREEIQWANTGPLANTVTTVAPNGPYDRWYDNLGENGAWVEMSSQKNAALREGINAERARRITEGCEATINGDNILVQGRDQDMTNLLGLVQAATIRMSMGDQSTLTPFRDGRNDTYQLTPLQIVTLWQSGASYVSAVYQYSWALKDMENPPEDYTDDQYWPAAQWPQP